MSEPKAGLLYRTLREDIDAVDGWVWLDYRGKPRVQCRVERLTPTETGATILIRLGTGGHPERFRTRSGSAPIRITPSRAEAGDVVEMELTP